MQNEEEEESWHEKERERCGGGGGGKQGVFFANLFLATKVKCAVIAFIAPRYSVSLNTHDRWLCSEIF